jgi:hypothetical protein
MLDLCFLCVLLFGFLLFWRWANPLAGSLSTWAVFRNQSPLTSAPAMDAWKEYAAWHEGRNVRREWAELEGKSATTREDLYRSFIYPHKSKPKPLKLLSTSAHVVAFAVEAWRMFRSG